MNLCIAGAMDQLLDEVDEEESATKEDFRQRNFTQFVGSAFYTFANLKINVPETYERVFLPQPKKLDLEITSLVFQEYI